MRIAITSREELGEFLEAFPKTQRTGGTIRMYRAGEEFYQLHLYEGKICDLRRRGKFPLAELCELFFTNGLIADLPNSEIVNYSELWSWLNHIVPQELHFHKERYRDALKNFTLKRLKEIDYEQGLEVEYDSAGTLPDSELLPSLPLSRVVTELMRESSVQEKLRTFSTDTRFVVLQEAMPQVSFEALVLLKLLKKHDEFESVTSNSMFPVRKTVNALRELLRVDAITQSQESSKQELNIIDLSDAISEIESAEPSESDQRKALLSSSLYLELKTQLSNEIEPPEKFPAEVVTATNSPRRLADIKRKKLMPSRKAPLKAPALKRATDENLLHAMSYLILILLFSLPWFFLLDMFKVFGP